MQGLYKASSFHGLKERVSGGQWKKVDEGHLLTLSISEPIFAGLSVTMTPAASRAETLSDAAPENAVTDSFETELRTTHPFHRQ